MENKTHYIYLLQEREFIKTKENIYKIGKTTQQNNNRFKQYPKGSILLFQIICSNCHKIEKNLIYIFKQQFKQYNDIGREYFEGDYKLMMDLIYKFVLNYTNVNNNNVNTNIIVNNKIENIELIEENYEILSIKELGYKLKSIKKHKFFLEKGKEELTGIYKKIKNKWIHNNINNPKIIDDEILKAIFMKENYYNKYTDEYFNEQIELLTNILNAKIIERDNEIKQKQQFINEEKIKARNNPPSREIIEKYELKTSDINIEYKLVDEDLDSLSLKELGYKLRSVQQHINFINNGQEHKTKIYEKIKSKWIQSNAGNIEIQNNNVLKVAFMKKYYYDVYTVDYLNSMMEKIINLQKS